ncbi:hypothetical protein A3Q56_01584 [Intoshia linei]|uniref:Uncharacterized protein n=1 Tax=Intoshia linei TaxID=1819745 RepID=A0A177B8N2_9BILA|nr:hypothetical protein A3Q56_01584 [Intoshia linei]
MKELFDAIKDDTEYDQEDAPKLVQFQKMILDTSETNLNFRNKRRTSSIPCIENINSSLFNTPLFKGVDVEGGIRIVNIIDTNFICMCLRFAPDGSHFAVGFSNGLIQLYTSPHGKLLNVLNDNESQACTSIHFNNNYMTENLQITTVLLASHISGNIRLWHYATQTCLFTINENRQTLYCSFSTDGSKFISCGVDCVIYTYDFNTCNILTRHKASHSKDKMNGHRGRVFSAKYHPNHKNVFISGGWDDTIQFWDDRETHSSRHISGPHLCGDGLDIDPENDQILTGSWRKSNTLQLWDFKTGNKIRDVLEDVSRTSQLYCVQFVSKSIIATAGSDVNDVRLIDRANLNVYYQFQMINQVIGRITASTKSFYAIDNDKLSHKPIYAGISDGKVYLFREEG